MTRIVLSHLPNLTLAEMEVDMQYLEIGTSFIAKILWHWSFRVLVVNEGAFKFKHCVTCISKLCQRGHQIIECWRCHRQWVQSKVPPLLEREENFETFANAAFFAGLSKIAEKADKRLGQRQVWPLTQFYSVDFTQPRIGVSKCVFNKPTIKVWVSCI